MKTYPAAYQDTYDKFEMFARMVDQPAEEGSWYPELVASCKTCFDLLDPPRPITGQ